MKHNLECAKATRQRDRYLDTDRRSEWVNPSWKRRVPKFEIRAWNTLGHQETRGDPREALSGNVGVIIRDGHHDSGEWRPRDPPHGRDNRHAVTQDSRLKTQRDTGVPSEYMISIGWGFGSE